MEFNADGSLKLSDKVCKLQEQEKHKMKTTRSVKITKDATRTFPPKLCTLTIEQSSLLDKNFVERSFSFFVKRVNSTMHIIKLSDTEFQITIGNEFSRCRDCQYLVSAFREGLFGNIIEKKGSCTYKGLNNL